MPLEQWTDAQSDRASAAQPVAAVRRASVADFSCCRVVSTLHCLRSACPVTGILKGYDPLLNLVLDETREFIRDPFDPYKITDATRALGLTVARGTAVIMVCPVDGTLEIANPFLQQEEQQAPVI